MQDRVWLYVVDSLKPTHLEQPNGYFVTHLLPRAARLLRRNLLQPITDRNTLELRLDTVAELLKHSLFFELTAYMSKLGDLDHLTTTFITVPKIKTQRTALSIIRDVVLVRPCPCSSVLALIA